LLLRLFTGNEEREVRGGAWSQLTFNELFEELLARNPCVGLKEELVEVTPLHMQYHHRGKI